MSGVALKEETCGWLPSGKLVAPKGDNIHRVTGNLYELDYQNHYEHVKDVSVPAGDTKLIYENGERMQEAEKRITGDADPDLGKFLRC